MKAELLREDKKVADIELYDRATEPVYELENVTVELRIQLYWKMVDEELGFMERMVLPLGEEILFDHELGHTNFEPLRKYIGFPCVFYRDGEYKWTKKLLKIDPNEDGVMALFFEAILDPPEEEDA